MQYFALIYSLTLLAAMLLCLELGRRYTLNQKAKETEEAGAGKGVIEGAFFGLLSLLIAFTLAGAISRFDSRRQLIIQESNDIGTAWLRVDLLPTDVQPQMRDLFRSYVDSRLALDSALPDIRAAEEHLARSIDLQNQIWALAVVSTHGATPHLDSGKLLLPALNSMIDISNTRTWAARSHPPVILWVFLFFIALVCAFIAGGRVATGRRRPWVHLLAFALLTVGSIYVILEIEYPRRGFIDLEKYDQALIDVRESMN
jgi:hypothetical protein